MSQVYVERIIGLLVTDEALRRRFAASPRETLLDMVGKGLELNECELQSLARLDTHELARFAKAIDARLQKSDLQRGGFQ